MVGGAYNTQLIEDLKVVQDRVLKRLGQLVVHYHQDAVEDQDLNLGTGPGLQNKDYS